MASLETSYPIAPPLLMTPGPVPVPPAVLRALSAPVEHHRTPGFQLCFDRIMKQLPTTFGTTGPCFVQVATGTGGMESLLVNVLSPGETVGAVVSGKFGERWADIATAYGAKVERFQVEWGQSAHLPTLKNWLSTISPKVVLTQACETSTGALHPVREMAQAVRALHPDSLFLVDGITALGALPLPMDSWGLDGVVGGSQKAFMIPTGLTFTALSARAWLRAQTATCPRYYFDLRSERAANQRGETNFSSAVPLLKALDIVLTEVNRFGSALLFKRIATVAQATREALLEIGLRSFPQTPSPTLTAITVPNGIDGQRWRNTLESQYGVTVMGGQDALKGQILRIGHMGYITDRDVATSFDALARSGRELGLAATEEDIASAIDIALEILKQTPCPWTEP